MGVTDDAVLPGGYTYRTGMECIRVGERLATMAIDRDSGGFRRAPKNCFGGATVVATSSCCGSSCTLCAGRGGSDEEGYDAGEEDRAVHGC